MDRHENCVEYAGWGECEKNPGWMIVNCALSCNACDLRDPKRRCNKKFLNISEESIIAPGQLNQIFERIEENAGGKFGAVTVLSRDPWVVTIDDFFSDKQAAALVKSVGKKWEQSTDQGKHFRHYTACCNFDA